MAFGLSPDSRSPQVNSYLEDMNNITRLQVFAKDGLGREDDFFVELMKFVNSVIGTRNQEYRIYEDFFQGGDRQKIYFPKFKNETDKQYTARLDKSVVSNKCKRIVRKGAQALYAFPVERRMEDEEAHKKMMEVWRYNRVMRGVFHLDLSKICGLYGYQIVRNVYVNKENRMPVTAKTGQGGNNGVWYVPLHPMLTIAIPRKDNQFIMGGVVNITMTNQVDQISSKLDYPEIATIEYVTDDEWLLWDVEMEDDGMTMRAFRRDKKFGPNYINKNPYGDVNIPFSLYINPGDSPYVLDGCSDLDDIVELQSKYNQTLSDDGHVISAHTFPIMLVSGLIVEKDYKRGTSDILSTKNSEAKGEYITWDADLEASNRYEERLESDMREASGFSPVSDGKLDKIGQVRNLRSAMVPDIMTVSEKQAYFSDNEQRHYESTLRMIEWHEGSNYENKDLNITYSMDYVPTDELTRAESQAIELNTGMENLRDIIKSRHPELESDEEIDSKVEETLELMKLVKEAQGETNEPEPFGDSERERAQDN